MRFSTGLFLGVLLAPLQPSAAMDAIRLRALPPTVHVRMEDSTAGDFTAKVACARGETESFQVVVTAAGRNLQGADAEVSPLTNASGDSIPSENVALFKEIFVPVRHSSPRATEAPGLIPDPLVPFTNPYTGERVSDPRWDGTKLVAGSFGAAGFDLWEGHNQPLWVDIRVPKDAPVGDYSGTVRVWAKDVETVELPIRLEVWDFVLPDGPTHENHFGGFGRIASYHNLKPSSEEFLVLEDRYIEMMAANRINPPLPARLHPKRDEDGFVTFDEDLDHNLTEFVERYHVTNIDVPRAPYPHEPGEAGEKARNFYRFWYAYLEKKGWEKGAYLYMLDEPNDATAYERVRQLGALVHEAEPRLRRLVVEQPYTQEPEWGTLDGSIDIWCPLFGFVHEPNVRRVLAQGDDVWSYTALVQPAPSDYFPDYNQVKDDNPPYWQIDFPLTAYRVAPWLNRRYGITGLLYWSTVCWSYPERDPWQDPGFRVRFNGEGMLFYPGEDAGIEGPIASIRLKNLRDGMEDYEYFTILADLGGKEVVDRIVSQAVPTWGSWDQRPTALPALRRQLAGEILKRLEPVPRGELRKGQPTPRPFPRGDEVKAKRKAAFPSEILSRCIQKAITGGG